jgi:hypothetical protein
VQYSEQHSEQHPGQELVATFLQSARIGTGKRIHGQVSSSSSFEALVVLLQRNTYLNYSFRDERASRSERKLSASQCFVRSIREASATVCVRQIP